MRYHRVGSSGLKVSRVSLGGWLTLGGSVEEGTADRIVGTALDHGVNFLDLADVYAEGEAERVVGRIVSGRRRANLVLSSKVFWPQSDDPNDRGLSRKHIMESVERSLTNLRTDYLDLYFCHREDPETPLDETLRAMDDLVHQGKVLYWGTSVFRPRTLLKAHALCRLHGLYPPLVEQPPYNLLDRHIERRLMPTVRRLGMGLVVWSPLAGGVLTGKYNDAVPEGSRGADTEWLRPYLTEDNLRRVRELCAIAREMGVEPSALALAWVLRRPEVASVITGATRPEHVTRNVAAAELELPDDVASRLDTLFRG